MTRTPPGSLWGILRSIGPGLIIAGSIVGSGELIATTKAGAEAGFWLLWLIVIGCVIKVFVQVELGRDAITRGETTLQSLNIVPGPRLRVNWIVWYWLVMVLASSAQMGGIVGGVGQALAIMKPLTQAGEEFNQYQDIKTRREVLGALLERHPDESSGPDRLSEERGLLEKEWVHLGTQLEHLPARSGSRDDVLWALLVTIITVILLVRGRYRFIQTLSTILVATFTAVTVWNLTALQGLTEWRVTWNDLSLGLSFHLPPSRLGLDASPVATALAAFGIIGVGASELVAYPYWCLEKGYASWTGIHDGTTAWRERARGWLKVLQWDAWLSAIVYTFATVAFYLLGAAVLGRSRLDPAGPQMIRTLSEMYVPVFGEAAPLIFLFGAFSVLYSTFFVASAGHARVIADALVLFGLTKDAEETRRRWTQVFSGVIPVFCFLIYSYLQAPVFLVLIGGVTQAIMLPMLAAGALYFRYRRSHPELRPGKWWDVALWLSSAGMLVAGGWAALSYLLPVVS